MSPRVNLAAEVCEAMIVHARFTLPNEACGLLATDKDGEVKMVYCLTNRDRSPHRFTVDPTEHYRALQHAERNGWEVTGAFHSHPTSAAVPSKTDVASALDPTWLYVLVGLADSRTPELRAFEISDGVAEEVTIVVDPPHRDALGAPWS